MFPRFLFSTEVTWTTLKSDKDQICPKDAASAIIGTECFFHLYGFFVTFMLNLDQSDGRILCCYSDGQILCCYSNGQILCCYSDGQMPCCIQQRNCPATLTDKFLVVYNIEIVQIWTTLVRLVICPFKTTTKNKNLCPFEIRRKSLKK